MLLYIILFCAIGFVLGLLFTPHGASRIILAITIGWAFVQGAWTLATLVELLFGFALGRMACFSIRQDS